MTITVPIKCDTCGTNLLLKIQCDDSLNHYVFHLHIYCKECGDEFDCTYSKMHDILPLKYRGAKESDAKYSVSYSPQLPVPLSSYYCDNKLHFLPIFQSLSLIYTTQIAIRHAGHIQKILDNVYPYRNILNELIPVMRKGNYNAFQKKMMKVLGIKHANRNIYSIAECRDVFAEFIEKIHANFATDCYQTCIEKDVASLCQTCIKEKSKADLEVFYQTMVPLVDFSKWTRDAEDFISKFLIISDKYYPAIFFLSVGDFNVPHKSDTVIETIDVDEANNYYKKSFDLLNGILPFTVALCNWQISGDINVFPNYCGSMKGVNDIEMFKNLTDGLKSDKLKDYTLIISYLADSYNTHVRNAIAHNNVDFYPESQVCEYHYNMNDNQKHDDFRLIDVCYMTFINILHILEMYLVNHKLKNRLS